MSDSQNQTLVLTGNDIAYIIQKVGLNTLMDELIDRLHQALQSFSSEKITIPIRSGFNYQQPRKGLVEWMPLYSHEEQVMIKVVGYHPDNPHLYGLPTIISTFSAYDTHTGHLLGVVDGVLLTALRTGAASAVASMYMALPSSKILGLIGCGAQAVTQLHALSRKFEFEKILIYDNDPAAMQSLQDRCQALGLQQEFIASSIPEIIENSDIVSTATSLEVGAGPLFEKLPTQPHLHINAVGSDFPGKVELPLDLLHKSFVCPDFTEQAKNEGECQRLDDQYIGPDWITLIQEYKQFHTVQTQTSVFDSTGYPLEDKVVMDLFFEYANQLGLGERIQIEDIPDDAKNPYHFLNKAEMVSTNNH